MPTIYITDLDGTLLRNDATLSPFARETLSRLLGEGLLFTVASARSIVSIRDCLGELPLSLPIIETNGSFLSEYATGRHLKTHAIEPGTACGLYEMLLARDEVPAIATCPDGIDRLCYDRLGNPGMQYWLNDRLVANDPRLVRLDRLEEALADPVICMTAIGPLEPMRRLEIDIETRYPGQLSLHRFESTYTPGWHWLMIQDGRATKSTAVSELLDEMQLGLDDLVYFGDNANDAALFELAGRRVAVANAIEPIRALATDVAESNENDGVVRVILDDWTSSKEHSPT